MNATQEMDILAMYLENKEERIMKRNYLLVIYNKVLDNFEHRYFETLSSMNEFIKKEIKNNNHKKIEHKYKLEEIK